MGWFIYWCCNWCMKHPLSTAANMNKALVNQHRPGQSHLPVVFYWQERFFYPPSEEMYMHRYCFSETPVPWIIYSIQPWVHPISVWTLKESNLWRTKWLLTGRVIGRVALEFRSLGFHLHLGHSAAVTEWTTLPLQNQCFLWNRQGHAHLIEQLWNKLPGMCLRFPARQLLYKTQQKLND